MHLLLNILSVFYLPILHDVPVANFTLHIHDTQATIEILIDQEDLVKALEQSNDTLSEATTLAYLASRFSMAINGSLKLMNYTSVTFGREHVIINGVIDVNENSPDTLIIYNTVLLDVIRKQYNNVFIHYQGDTRSFLMNKNRTEITHELDD